MSEALHELATDSAQPMPAEVHSDLAGYDGSRTPPDVQYEVMRRHRLGMCIADICKDLHGKGKHCDPRTAKAVIENWGNSAHKLYLEAHKPQLVENVILSWSEAAKRGKSDSLKAWTDSFGITEPVKTHQTSVGVQVILNGGAAPSELSRAKVAETSEGVVIQAQSEAIPISPVMLHNGAPNTNSISELQGDVNITLTATQAPAEDAR